VVSFESRVRVLHAMWEQPNPAPGEPATWDEIRKRRGKPDGLREIESALWGLTTPGITLGPDYAPEGWKRALWRDLAARWSVEFDLQHSEPMHGFKEKLQGGSWPITISPMNEGSLDDTSFGCLIPILLHHTESSMLWRMNTTQIWYSDPFSMAMRHGPMDEMISTYGDEGSGTNWWPDDGGWLVCSNYDITTTIVQGSEALIEEIRRDQYLESVDMPPFQTGMSYPDI
jgi:hypothetical protein